MVGPSDCWSPVLEFTWFLCLYVTRFLCRVLLGRSFGGHQLLINYEYLGLHLFFHKLADLLRPFQRELEMVKRGEWGAQIDK